MDNTNVLVYNSNNTVQNGVNDNMTAWNIIMIRLMIMRDSKMVLWVSPMHIEGNELCIIYPLIYGSVL